MSRNNRPVVIGVDASHDAEGVVLGAQGVSGFSPLVSGSTARHVAAHAGCPVVTVPTSESESHGGRRRRCGGG